MSFESAFSSILPRPWLASLGNRWWLAATLYLLIRAIASVIDYPALQADPDAYRALAEGWSASGTFGRATQDGVVAATAYRPPLYPWLLSWLVGKNGLWLPGVALLHVLLGCLTSLLTWDIARRLMRARLKESYALKSLKVPLIHGQETGVVADAASFGSDAGSIRHDDSFRLARAIPWLAGLMVALDPILLRQSSLVMTETVAAFMAVLIWWMWLCSTRDAEGIQPPSAACIGALMGLSCLLRPSSLVWCPTLIGVIAIHRWRVPKAGSRALFCGTSELVLFGAMILVLVPWAVRNRVVMGSTVWTTTHGGYTLLLANNPILFRHFELEGGTRMWNEDRFHHLWSQRKLGDPRETEYWDATDTTGEAIYIADEVIDDRLANQTAWTTIARSPMLFAKACLIRISWLWACWPAPGQASLLLRIVIGGWYSAILLIFAYGSVRGVTLWWSRRLSASTVYGWLPAISLVIALTAVHCVYWSNMRMRAPLIPIVAIVAATTLSTRRWTKQQ